MYTYRKYLVKLTTPKNLSGPLRSLLAIVRKVKNKGDCKELIIGLSIYVHAGLVILKTKTHLSHSMLTIISCVKRTKFTYRHILI